MTRKSNAQKFDFLYALSARINEVAVIAHRKGCGEVGQHIVEIVDFVAAEIGYPNAESFCRAFRKFFGRSASEYRQAYSR